MALPVPVRTLIKGDLRCSSIAAASVLAKTERDAMLIALAEQYPVYGFAENKAYASPQHLAALRRARAVSDPPLLVEPAGAGRPGGRRRHLDGRGAAAARGDSQPDRRGADG